MDPHGDRIRNLTTMPGPSFFDEKMTDQIAAYAARCGFRNQRGECANPNVRDEDGDYMSWDKFDAKKASGIDPRKVDVQRQFNRAMEDMRGVSQFNFPGGALR